MKTTKNDSTMTEIFNWIDKTCYDEKKGVYIIVPANMTLIEEKIAQALLFQHESDIQAFEEILTENYGNWLDSNEVLTQQLKKLDKLK